ncbi:hypothetical protein [Tissierella pigra]|uniref:Uncharacterized protein n=1 Tax=Tissierella pigra TaxID=2607614 RepID=A0A6N7XJA8_9FIRM|nr:hypothetical protein [Tissierella pigra]MSU02139.1 hypothetical protein [Tissierella pigra]
MGSLWGDIKKEDKIIVPNTIIKEQDKILGEITSGLVNVEIKEIKNKRLKDAEFAYDVSLISYRMENYNYPIFRIEYNVSIYPVRVILNVNIQDIDLDPLYQIGNNEHGEYVLEATDKENFIRLLENILASKQMTNIIRSIMALSEQIGKEPDFEIPF